MNDEEIEIEGYETEEGSEKDVEEWAIIEPTEKKTEITVEEKAEKTDKGKCPYCGSTNIGKDPKHGVYVCFTCKKTYLWEG